MRLRILISGLSFFAAAIAIAALPALAEGSSKTSVKPCTVVGTNGPDSLLGSSGADVICGRGGADTIYAGGGNDEVRGGGGADRLQGGGGGDTVRGGSGNDLLFAYDGTRDRGLDIVRSIESI